MKSATSTSSKSMRSFDGQGNHKVGKHAVTVTVTTRKQMVNHPCLRLARCARTRQQHPKHPKHRSPPLSKPQSSKRNLVGKTVTTTSPPTAATTDISDFSPPCSNKTIDSNMQSVNTCKWFLVVLVSFFFLASTLGLLLSLSDHKSQHRLSRAQPGSDLACIGRP